MLSMATFVVILFTAKDYSDTGPYSASILLVARGIAFSNSAHVIFLNCWDSIGSEIDSPRKVATCPRVVLNIISELS